MLRKVFLRSKILRNSSTSTEFARRELLGAMVKDLETVHLPRIATANTPNLLIGIICKKLKTVEECSPLISSYALTDRIEEAELVFWHGYKKLKGTLSVNVYNLFIESYLKRGNFFAAIEWNERIVRNGLSRNLATFSLFISFYLKEGRTAAVKEIAGQMGLSGYSIYDLLNSGFIDNAQFALLQNVTAIY